MKTYWPTGTISGRMSGNHKPRMQNIPRLPKSLEEQILNALKDGHTRTFSQIELLCGATDPLVLMSSENMYAFSDKVDRKLQDLIACGKVILVARRPTLCFKIGTVLDRICREIDLDGNSD